MTDYYGLEAQKLKLMPSEFIKKARNINGKDKDNFKKGILWDIWSQVLQEGLAKH